MRMMMQMMEQAGQNLPNPAANMQQHFNNQTLEINPANSIIVNLNHLRKTDPKLASMVSKQVLNNVMMVSGVPFDPVRSTELSYNILERVLDANLQSAEDRAGRKIKEQAPEEEIPITEDGESILKKASRNIKNEAGAGRKITQDYKVTEKDFRK